LPMSKMGWVALASLVAWLALAMAGQFTLGGVFALVATGAAGVLLWRGFRRGSFRPRRD